MALFSFEPNDLTESHRLAFHPISLAFAHFVMMFGGRSENRVVGFATIDWLRQNHGLLDEKQS